MPTKHAVLAWLRANPAGGGCDDIAQAIGAEQRLVEFRITDLVYHKQVAGYREPKGKAYSRKRWYAIEHLPAGPTVLPKPKKHAPVKLYAEAPIVGKVPKPTKCPGFTGAHRHEFIPPAGWRGEITRDWLDQRKDVTVADTA